MTDAAMASAFSEMVRTDALVVGFLSDLFGECLRDRLSERTAVDHVATALRRVFSDDGSLEDGGIDFTRVVEEFIDTFPTDEVDADPTEESA